MFNILLKQADMRYRLYGCILVVSLLSCIFGFFSILLTILVSELIWMKYGNPQGTKP